MFLELNTSVGCAAVDTETKCVYEIVVKSLEWKRLLEN